MSEGAVRLVQALVAGLGAGSIYALLAIGFVVIYKATRVISFAQPGLMMAGGTLISILAVDVGLGFWASIPLGVVAAGVLGLVVERLALRPMVGKPVFVAAIITLGVDSIVRVVTNRFIGVNVRTVGDPWGLATLELAGVEVPQRFVWITVVTAVIAVALLRFFSRSRMGLAMRATAFDQEAALAQGVNVGAVFALSWAIAAGLAAVAGAFVGAASGLDQQTWVIGLKALPAIVLGGLDSVGGAMVGGVVIGVFEALVAVYQPELAPWLGDNFSPVSPYLLMLLVLLVRPYGLFGTPEVERV
ncbi:MAG: branched-chain amino acid ABC transporter permease [Egibacteraceae bacterium]